MEFIETVKARRSNYSITNKIDISDDELIKIIKDCVKHTPTAYNAQSPRVMLLLDKRHETFWNIVKEALKEIVPEDKFPRTEKKINSFKAGYGTILYFDDTKTTNDLGEKFPLYKQNFLRWAEQQNGMLQVNIWNALKTRNIGASLQHYNELIEEKIKQVFDIPQAWSLIAQMPFGNITEKPKEKEFIDIDKRFIIKK